MKEYIKFFKNYTDKFIYDDKDRQKHIDVKKEHSFYVYGNSIKYLKESKLKENEKVLKFISLFHDIGRFSQLDIYQTFDDFKSVDHGYLGCKVINNENLLEDFSEKERNIISSSIFNHNKFSLTNDCDDETLHYCKLIRDFDKLDIYRVHIKYYIDNNKITEIDDGFYKLIMNEQTKNYSEIKSDTDLTLLMLSWAFDFNSQFMFKQIIDNKYFNQLFDLLLEGEKRDNIKNKIFEYIKSKIN